MDWKEVYIRFGSWKILRFCRGEGSFFCGVFKYFFVFCGFYREIVFCILKVLIKLKFCMPAYRQERMDNMKKITNKKYEAIIQAKNIISRKGRVGCCRIYSCRGKRQTDQYKKIRRKFYFFCKNQAYYICNTKQAQLRARLCICPAYTVWVHG